MNTASSSDGVIPSLAVVVVLWRALQERHGEL